jgi:hypothetical protein
LGDLFAHTASTCKSPWTCLASSIADMAYVPDVPRRLGDTYARDTQQVRIVLLWALE